MLLCPLSDDSHVFPGQTLPPCLNGLLVLTKVLCPIWEGFLNWLEHLLTRVSQNCFGGFPGCPVVRTGAFIARAGWGIKILQARRVRQTNKKQNPNSFVMFHVDLRMESFMGWL